MPEENCNATCLKAREFVNCETDKAKAEIEQAKKMTRNRQAQDQACAGIKESECNKEANEWLYPTVPKDVGSYFNCSQYLPEKGPAELLKVRQILVQISCLLFLTVLLKVAFFQRVRFIFSNLPKIFFQKTIPSLKFE